MKRPLFWHQGVFLQPQHFQQDNLYSQSLLSPFYKLLHPHFRGVADLEFPGTMSGTTFDKPVRAELIFPDMTHVVYPGNALIQARIFDESWIAEDKPFTVYVGLKKMNDAGENVTILDNLEDLSDVTTRYVTVKDPEKVRDLHQNGPAADMKKLYFVLRLFGETELDQLGDYSLIPLARLEKDVDEVIFSKRFVPPCLSISAFDSLFRIVREIRDQITLRAHTLEEYKRQRGIHSVEFGTRDMSFLLALRSLNRYVQPLSFMTETKQIHPWQVYGILGQLSGELSTFSDEINVLGETGDREKTKLFPAYNHDDLWECFSAAQSLIVRLMDDITAGPEYILPLLFDGTYFSADLQPHMLEGRNKYYLVFATETDPKSLIQPIEVLAKLSSRESLPFLIARALPGIQLTHLTVPPQELPRRSRSIYFKIDEHHEQWPQVEQGRNMAIYWEGAPEDLKIELMAVGGG